MRAAFYKGTRPGLQGIYSRAVRLIDRGPYSHCELVFSDGISAPSSWMDGGVRLKRIEYNPQHWDFIELPAHLEPAARVWFEAHKGDPYDLLGNLHFVFFLVKESSKGWFCNEAMAASLGILQGWRLGPNGLASILYSINRLLENDKSNNDR
jgi:hypothetical protein